MIIVTGATGHLGRATVQRLLKEVPADQVGVSVRDPEAARDLADAGVRVRRGDFADPASLAEAFEGVTRLLLVSVDQVGEPALALHRAAVEAAVTAGAERIFYTSHMGARPGSPFAPADDHATTEAVLAGSGVPYVSLRNGFYVSSLRQLVGHAVQTGELVAPADAPVAWTATADLAEAAAIALASDRFDGPTPPLTGPEVLDFEAVAGILGVRRVVVSDEEYVARLVGAGVPEGAARMLAGMFEAARAGDFAPADPTLGSLLGRPPVDVRTALAEMS